MAEHLAEQVYRCSFRVDVHEVELWSESIEDPRERNDRHVNRASERYSRFELFVLAVFSSTYAIIGDVDARELFREPEEA